MVRLNVTVVWKGQCSRTKRYRTDTNKMAQDIRDTVDMKMYETQELA